MVDRIEAIPMTKIISCYKPFKCDFSYRSAADDKLSTSRSPSVVAELLVFLRFRGSRCRHRYKGRVIEIGKGSAEQRH